MANQKSGRAAPRSTVPSRAQAKRTVRGPWLAVVGIVAVTLLGAAVYLALNTARGGRGGVAPQAEGPRLALNETSYDFGRVPFERVVERSFTLTNVGSESLNILGTPTVQAVEGC
jgi:hypothetical protein